MVSRWQHKGCIIWFKKCPSNLLNRTDSFCWSKSWARRIDVWILRERKFIPFVNLSFLFKIRNTLFSYLHLKISSSQWNFPISRKNLSQKFSENIKTRASRIHFQYKIRAIPMLSISKMPLWLQARDIWDMKMTPLEEVTLNWPNLRIHIL